MERFAMTQTLTVILYEEDREGLDMVFTRPILPAPFDTSLLLGDEVLVVAVDEETEEVVDLDATVFSQFWKDRCVPAIDDPVRGQDQEEPAPRAADQSGADTGFDEIEGEGPFTEIEAAVEEDPTVIEESDEQDSTEETTDSELSESESGSTMEGNEGSLLEYSEADFASCGDGESHS